jgi:hypothetical protein
MFLRKTSSTEATRLTFVSNENIVTHAIKRWEVVRWGASLLAKSR